jgi:hypothetical protein
VELLGWLRSLSDSYEAEWGRPSTEKKDAFPFLLHISLRREINGQSVAVPMFVLRFEATFKTFDLRLDLNAQTTLLPDLTTRVSVSEKSGYDLRCEYSIYVNKPADLGKFHPWNVVYNRLTQLAASSDHPEVPVTVPLIMNPELTALFAQVREDEQQRNNLSAMLAVLTGGIVQTILVPKEKAVEKMEPVDQQYLFGLTCVFPWAVDLLFKKPVCAMTDSTFKAAKPYTLAVLHLIFANESIPIGFGLSPSETALSYRRLYALVLDRLKLVCKAAQDHTPTKAAGPFPLPELQPASLRWDDEHPEEEDELEELLETTTDADKDDRDVEVVSEPVTLGLIRGVQVNELPEVPDRPRDRTAASRVCPGFLLLDLPILTDQGSALQSFVKDLGLWWILCHRHIIEAIRANGRVADWVLRILRCYSKNQFLRVRETILNEILTGQNNMDTTADCYLSVLRLLGLRPNDNSPYCDIYCWALWLRPGCPRTTNSAESVNGHLNAEILEGETFPQRVFSLAKHFIKRYETRHQWHNRSLIRNRFKCYPPENVYRPQDEVHFYLQLHDAVDKTFDDRKSQKFPGEMRQLFFPPVWIWEENCNPTLPHGWAVNGSLRKTKSHTFDGEEKPVVTLTEESAKTPFNRKAWQIVWSLRKDIGAARWERYGQEINTQVHAKGHALGISVDGGKLSPAAEARWRCACWDSLSDWTREPAGVQH